MNKPRPTVTGTLIQEDKNLQRKRYNYPKDFKYILLWTKNDKFPFDRINERQRAFLKNNCSVIKCYVTINRHFFRGNLTEFDAVAFSGQNLHANDLPSVRSMHQKSILFNPESADNYPIHEELYDGFFNWTATYRLDSDIPFPYIQIRDSKGIIVGPKQKMRWKEDMAEVGDEFADRIANKTKAAAWFVSHCKTMRYRESYMKELRNALMPYGLTVDVYGKCGPLQCDKSDWSVCTNLLKRDYFFYMSMENSFDDDYVTEKLLTALQNDVVPIVYGGADYSRFLPPGYYINALNENVLDLAAIMHELIHSPNKYKQYIRWKHHYTYHTFKVEENACLVCKALHDKETFEETTIYKEFRQWWNRKNRTKYIVSYNSREDVLKELNGDLESNQSSEDKPTDPTLGTN